MARSPARARKPKKRKARIRKKAKTKAPKGEEVLLEEEKYSYQGTFKPKRAETL